ncbi:MAG: SCP2 sterol-binding domain-containing protein, partial [Armatimonadetes bacterium]|nr:SCP2 sterol-binding domain-containing protein [Armatimonadota bacterium]
LYLCSEGCPVSGHIYNAGAGYFSRAAVLTGPSTAIGGGMPPSPEAIHQQWKAITSLDGASEYDDAMAALQPMLTGKPTAKKAPAAKAAASPKEAPKAGGGKVQAVFANMPKAFNKEAAAGVDVVFQYSISGPGGGEYIVAVKDGALSVEAGTHPKPTTTLAISDADFLELIGGKLNPMQAYTTGKLKIGGDLMKSQLVAKLFKF